ncbi:hypothetical protein MRB53_032340 [Persea americana]|uniref:Uncharacterized protein n=1 Tax=Persea americana TaxID=3435 RepID=A0ACC2KS25_PERAE|nr:hypothetical protein MRB53_032340 [Persea americana]
MVLNGKMILVVVVEFMRRDKGNSRVSRRDRIAEISRVLRRSQRRERWHLPLSRAFVRTKTFDFQISFSELLLRSSTVLVPNLYKFLSFGSGQLGLVGFYLGMMGIFGSSTKCRICRV